MGLPRRPGPRARKNSFLQEMKLILFYGLFTKRPVPYPFRVYLAARHSPLRGVEKLPPLFQGKN